MSTSLNYTIENPELHSYRCNQNVLIKISHLSYLDNYKQSEDSRSSQSQSQSRSQTRSSIKWYPYVNSYYQYGEDYDAVNRVRHLLEVIKSESSINSNGREETSLVNASRNSSTGINTRNSAFSSTADFYSEKFAAYKFLRKKPTSFIILGKPEIGEDDLGRLLANHWNSVYIHPEDLIRDEINAETRAGICIEYNLRSGRSISIDVVIRLLQKKINEESVKHRGFVLCGFPLVSNTLFQQDPVSSESAVFTVHDIFEEIFDAVVIQKEVAKNVSREGSVADEGNEDGEEKKLVFGRSDEGKRESVSKSEEEDKKEKRSSLTKRVSLSKSDPDWTEIDEAGDSESGSKRSFVDELKRWSSKEICYESHQHDEHKNQMSFVFKLCENHECVIIYLKCGNEEVVNIRKDHRLDALTLDHLNLQREKFMQFDDSYGFIVERKLLKPQRDFPVNTNAQLDAYRFEAQTVIEKQILLQNPDYFIKLDGRLPPERMFHSLKLRLRVLPLSQSVIPEMMAESDLDGDMESPKDNLTDFTNSTPEEWFEELHKKKTIGKMFKLSLSDWEYLCPVALTQGKPEYAVKFMNKLFFLSGEEECGKFITNPRPYLLPPFPQTKRQKIFVIGPPSSGKSCVCEVLVNLLGVIRLDPKTMQEEYLSRKRSEMITTLKAKSVNEALTILKFTQQEKLEEERLERIQDFVAPIKKLIEKYINCLDVLQPDTLVLEMTSLPRPSGVHKTQAFADCESQLPELEQAISDFGIPIKNRALLEEALSNDEVLYPFIPKKLMEPVEDVAAVSIHDPFVEEYSAKVVEEYSAKPAEEAEHELLDEFSEYKSFLRGIQEAGSCDNGWIIDGFPPKVELYENLGEDDLLGDQSGVTILILNDQTEGMAFLKNRRPGENIISDLNSFFLARNLDEIVGNLEDETNIEQQGLYSIMEYSELIESSKSTLYLKTFDEHSININNFKAFLKKEEIQHVEFVVNGKTIEALAGEVADYADEKFFETPRILNDQDRLLEIEDFAQIVDEEADEEDDKLDDNYFQENRRLGLSNQFCAYTLAECNVLWRGKEEFSARYSNETYLFCSEEALEAFVKNPKRILRNFQKEPPLELPPAKICVVGSWKIGKTTLSKFLAENFGLNYVNYDKLINFNFKKIDVLDYVNSDVPLEEKRLIKLLKSLWLNRKTGFILDGFPKRPSDVLLMCKHMLIPDLIIELQCEDYALHGRLMGILLNEWQIEMDLMKMRQQEEDRKVYEEWKVLRERRFRELAQWKRDERYAAKKRGIEEVVQVTDFAEGADAENLNEQQEVEVEDQQATSKLAIIEELEETEHEDTNSLVSYRSVEEQEDFREIELLLDEECPEPGFHDNWETEETARERIEQDVETFTMRETNYLVVIKEKCLEESLPWETIDANCEAQKVSLQSCNHVLPHKYRNPSIFERVYDVSIELAERLLEQGYYFLSRFGKTCPVQMLEKDNYLQLLVAFENRFQLFPMIHKRYIYFIAGQENRVKFKEDCLKYIKQDYKDLPLIPVRVALTGPPKSGKSTLAERLGYEYGFKIISVGKAIEYVLKFLSKSALAGKVEAELRSGVYLNDELAMACVEALGFEDKGVAVGFVMDGFPKNVNQVRILAGVNLLPNLIVDLNTDLEYVFTYMDANPRTHRPEYSKKFIAKRYESWRECQEVIRKWIDKEYQNLAVIKIDPGKWKFWKTAEKLLLAVVSEIKYYYTNKDEDVPLRIANLLVSPHEFLQRKSRFKNFCPCCLYENNTLRHGGNPPDRTNLLQYRDLYYWLCENHIDNFTDNPEIYLNNIPHSLPISLPEIIALYSFPEDAYENGLCVICLEKGKPERVFNEGLIQYAIKYVDRIYLFDTNECLNEFLARPGKFCSVSINFRGKPYSNLEMTELPTLGFLEQFDANQVVKAVTEVNSVRPLIMGLNVSRSALILLALCLKIKNPNTPKEHVEIFKGIKERVSLEKCELRKSLRFLKQTINPFLHYQEPLRPFTFEGSKRDLSTIEEEFTAESLSEQGDWIRTSTTDGFPSLSVTSTESVVANVLDNVFENATR